MITSQEIEKFRQEINKPSTQRSKEFAKSSYKISFLKNLGNRLKFIKESDTDFANLIISTNLMLNDLHQLLSNEKEEFSDELDTLFIKLCSESNSLANQLRRAQDPKSNTIFLEKISESDFFNRIKLLGKELVKLAPHVGCFIPTVFPTILPPHFFG